MSKLVLILNFAPATPTHVGASGWSLGTGTVGTDAREP
jgi:hypothetical protein